ncbi:MAG TPA: hypothetical protein VMG08_17075 [Allosphingosinicella sp.]|nr:hypothetical protein [Allosphingosinicella sp.]
MKAAPTLACLSALLLVACETTEERLINDAANEEANAELLTNCELTGATLTNSRLRYRLALPPALYATRNQAPTAGRIACMNHWAREHGVTLTIVEARR